MVQNHMIRKGFVLEPLDVLSFRDGKPFAGGSHAKSGLPYPQTLAGALRTALMKAFGCDFQRLGEAIGAGRSLPDAFETAGAPGWILKTAFRGPWLAHKDHNTARPFVVLPANIKRVKEDKKKYVVLKPWGRDFPSPGWKPPEDEPQMRPLWMATPGRSERVSGFLSFSGLSSYLSGRTVPAQEIIATGEDNPLYGIEERTGIGIDPETLSVTEGLIYSSGFLSLRSGVVFYGEALFPETAPADVLDSIDLVSFGGEGRKALLHQVDSVRWPCPSASPGQKAFYLVTTPAFFSARWKPLAFHGKIVAAAVGEGLPISGWDLSRGGPKPNRFAVPAGSVYFLDEQWTETIENLSEGGEDLLAGYGCCLKGVWNDADEPKN